MTRPHAHGVANRWWAADWQKHGRAAGPIRNETMLREGRPDVVLAFPGLIVVREGA